MHFAPCGIEDSHDDTDIKDQVHLHNNIGNVVHIHASGITWADLFTSLEFEIPGEKITYYLNGVEKPELINQAELYALQATRWRALASQVNPPIQPTIVRT